MTWKCDNCLAMCVTTHQLELIFLEDENSHNHEEVSLLSIAKGEIRNEIKRKATETPNEKPARIMGSAFEEMEKIVTGKDLVNFRKLVNRERLITRPALPKDVKEAFGALELMHENNEKIPIDTDFVMKKLSIHIDEKKTLAMLYTEESIEALCSEGTIQLADGTFKY